ncbi:MAG: group III truncated hemoglobin [Saprospiraceae bacterium]
MNEHNAPNDILTRTDIILLIDTFYEKIKVNTLLRPVFIDIAQINFEHHMPILYDFWCTMLLGEMTYSRNAMEVHLQLNQKTPLTKAHFDEWLKLFTETVDENYLGAKAEEAKYRATNIAGLMLYKIEQMVNKYYS